MKNRIVTFTLIMMTFQGCTQTNQENSQKVETSETNNSLANTNDLKASELKNDNPLYSLLGKDVFGKEVFEFTSTLGIYESETMKSTIHLQYFDAGVEIVYNADDHKISSIFLLGPNYSNWYEPYTGELPYEFNWNTTKSEVESIIGNAKETKLMSEIYYQYEHHKIEILYFKGSENPKIQSIQIRNFEE